MDLFIKYKIKNIRYMSIFFLIQYLLSLYNLIFKNKK
jgi:hypothetical protein